MQNIDSEEHFSPAKYNETGARDEFLPALNHLDYQSDGKRTPFREKECLGTDPQWVPDFLSCCSWIFPEQLRNKSELVGSEEIIKLR